MRSIFSKNLNHLSDEDLFDLFITDQKEAAFAVIYERYSNSLFKFIYRFTLNKNSAEDLLGDIFVQLMSNKYNSSDEGSLKSWLFTVAKNKSLNYIKRKKTEVFNDDYVNQAVSSLNQETELINLNLRHKLKLVEATLPHELKQTWGLRKNGLNYQEIATELVIPVGTVKSRFSRIVELFKKEFEA